MDTSPVPPAAVHAQLVRMLASETFRGAERSKTLLRFIVEEALQGRTDRLKDYTLGAEALGRGDQFDPRVDPIARVEASRLRSRLDLYYATEGSADAVRISLPKGGYVPQFEARPIGPTTSTLEPLLAQTAALDPSRSANRLRQPPWLLAGIAAGLGLVVITTVGVFIRGTWRAPAAAEVRAAITTPPTTDPVSLAISPDGRAIVFVASTEGRSQLWLRPLDTNDFRPLPGTENASLPFWSPNGRSVGFFADGRVKRIDLENGLVRVLSTAPVAAGATWSGEGVILHPLVPDGPILRTSAEGAPLESVTTLGSGQTGHRGPVFLSDGRHFLFYAAGTPPVRGIHVGELGHTTVRRLVDADAPAVFAAPDHLLYVKRSTLFAHRLDPRTITLIGEPVALAAGVTFEGAAGVAAIAASANGSIVYRTGQSGGQRRFVLVDRAGKELSQIGSAEARRSAYASISPDRRRLAVQRMSEGNTDIWTLDVDRGIPVRFTDGLEADIAPLWSPKSDRIVYSSMLSGAFELFEKQLDGSPATLLLRTGESKQVTDWSRDGRYLLYRVITSGQTLNADIWALPLDGDRKPFPVLRTRFEERDAQFSPDGDWIAYHSDESGQHEVYVQPFQGQGERVRISTAGGVQARWRDDGRELFYMTLDGQLVAVPIVIRKDGLAVQPGPAVPLFHARIGSVQDIARHHYIVAAGGQRFLVDTVVEQTAVPISLILNWKTPGE
jgi:Tol biopolymer transport system component